MDATNGSPVPLPIIEFDMNSYTLFSRSQENEASNSGNPPCIRSMSVERSRPRRPSEKAPLNCPRCNSTNTKFCYYNNYSLTQPRYFCKTCRRYWNLGGSFRNLPIKNKRSSSPQLARHVESPDSSNTNEIAAVIESFNTGFDLQERTPAINPGFPSASVPEHDTGFDLQAAKPTDLAFPVRDAYNRAARAAAGATGVDGVSGSTHRVQDSDNILFPLKPMDDASITGSGSDRFEPNKGQLGEADQNQPNQAFKMINLDEQLETDN